MRSIWKLLKKRRSGGFTLVEMVVSVALLAILLGGMMLFIAPIVRSFNDTKRDLTVENAATAVEEYITKSIRNASQIAIFSYTNDAELTSGDKQKIISDMNKYCVGINKDAKGLPLTEGKEKYLLKCISLRYDESTQKYILCQESVDMNGNGALKSVDIDKKKVFSDCLYNDVYLTFDMRMPENGDYNSTDTTIYNRLEKYRSDTLQMTIRAYSDPSRNNKVFEGTGISELRQIKFMRQQSKTNDSEYFMKMVPSNPEEDGSVHTFGEATSGNRNIYIYYAIRRLSS